MKYGIMGASGRMGKELLKVFGPENCVLSVSLEGEDVRGEPQVMLDFSRPQALARSVELCERYGAALVVGTTALDEKHFEMLQELARWVPVVQGYNFSMGIGILREILRQYAPALSEWDAEVVEAHHVHKVDAPSGTAIRLGEAVGRECPTHSLRLGGVPGDHSVIFANQGEVLSFSHRAVSRGVFALGALKAAAFALEQDPGFYCFEEVVACALKRS
ncbi:MAG: 4-hydroxy-tetrahydrodipicolinate reductase [Dethiosulfovibrio peptidovorans]|nr:MAG: 4-hydroxy-tetrahydrodipicolinate reductase [Dethiosulfovibrio peptidovorans]